MHQHVDWMKMNKMKPLKFIFVVLFGSVIISLSVILSISAYVMSSEQVRKEMGVTLSESAYTVSEFIDLQLYSKYNEITILRNSNEFMNGEIETIAETIEEVQENFQGYTWLGYVSLDGKVLASTNSNLIGKDVTSYTAYQNGLTGRFVNTLSADKSISGNECLAMSTPVYSLSGKINGVFIVNIDLYWLKEIVDSQLVSLRKTNKLEVYIVDANNTVLLGDEENMGSTLTLESIKKAQNHLNSYLVETWPDGNKYLTGYVMCNGYRGFYGLDWVVFASEPDEIISGRTEHLFQNILIIGLACTIIFSAIGWLIANKISKPLKTITKVADKIRLGEDVEFIEYKGNIEEVKILVNSLRHLINSLNNTEEALLNMENVAYKDALTGLANRKGLEHYIEIERKHFNMTDNLLTILYLDLDGFKPVNDTYSHNIGDLLLIEVGQRLKAAVRLNEVVARFGGDEFVIVLTTTKISNNKQIKLVCERILEYLREPFEIEGNKIEIGCSIGCANWLDLNDSFKDILEKADNELYVSKHNGKNRFTLAE